MSAAGALIDMTAQCGGTTPSNGQQHFDMHPPEPMAVSLDEGISRGADDIGHLQGRPAHLLLAWWLVVQGQRVQRTRRGMEVSFGEVQVNGGLFQISMT